jgi:hypothetical protein
VSSSRKSRWKTKDLRQQLATAYKACVRTSFASQLPTMVDRNMALVRLLRSANPRKRNFKMSAMASPTLGVLRLAEPGGMSYTSFLSSTRGHAARWYLASMAAQERSAVSATPS